MEFRTFLRRKLKGVPVWAMLIILVTTAASICVFASTIWTHTVTWTVTPPSGFTVYAVSGNPFDASQEGSTSQLILTAPVGSGGTETVSGDLTPGTYYFYYVTYNPNNINQFNVTDSPASGATASWKCGVVQTSLPSALNGFGGWEPLTTPFYYQAGYCAFELTLTVTASGSYTFSFTSF